MAKNQKPGNPDDKYSMSPHARALLEKDPEGDSADFIPRKEINWDKVETAMAFGGSLMECAAEGGVHYNTLERRVLERYGENFRVVRDAMLTNRKMMARKQLFNLVAKGNVRATLFANRALNKLNDRLREDEDDDRDEAPSFRLSYSLDDKPPVDADFTEIEEKP